MPPSTQTYLRRVDRGRSAGRRHRHQHVFDRADLVEREVARADDRPAGLDRDDRHRDAEGGALGRHDAREVRRDLARSGHDVGARVRDAEAAAEVQLGHVAAVEQRGVHGEQPARGLGETVGLEDLRSDVRVQAEEPQRMAPGSAPRTSGASASGMPNFWSSRAVARYSWVDACTPLLMRSRTGWMRPWRAPPRQPGRSRRRCRGRSPRRRPRPRGRSRRGSCCSRGSPGVPGRRRRRARPPVPRRCTRRC